MEKKKEYIDQILSTLRSLETKVLSVKQDEAVPFSFFREAFQQAQSMMNLLHELEMHQIEDMKRQMERLVLVLSENGTPDSPKNEMPEYENALKPEEPDSEEEQIEKDREKAFSEETLRIMSEENIARRNILAEGVTLPTYTNPRVAEPQKTVGESNENSLVEPCEEKHPPRSVNDIIQAPPAKLDIQRGLSLNDRFFFQRELFENNREAMNSMMIRLNAFDNYAETEKYLRENTSWNFDSDTVADFLLLLKKNFQ